MIKGITSTGFKFEIEDDVLDDWNILKYLKKIDEGEIEYIIDVVPLLLGKEQEEKLEKHLKEFEGRIRMTSMAKEISEIMESGKDLKN